MRLSGEWLPCSDGEIRPVFRGALLGNDGVWRIVWFLVDTGADRTVFSANVLHASHLPTLPLENPLGGIGGIVDAVMIQSKFRIRRDDGENALFRGLFAACTQIEALDMSVLGRDILDLFTLIADRRAGVVALLSGHHSYTIHGPKTG